MTKTTEDNDMIDHIGVIYVKNKTEPSRLIGQGVVYDEDNT